MLRPLTFRHLYVLETLARDPAAFHGRDVLISVGDRTLADVIERGFIDTAGGGRRGDPIPGHGLGAGVDGGKPARAPKPAEPPKPLQVVPRRSSVIPSPTP